MLVQQLQEIVARMLTASGGRMKDAKLAVVIQHPGGIGGTPSVPIKSIAAGFDWDAGKLLIYPESPLSMLSAEQLQELHSSAIKGESWHAFERHKKIRQERSDQAKRMLELIEEGSLDEVKEMLGKQLLRPGK